ncbi:hypothetical protein PFISCL1PPCAC_13027, partial [Pristionchus fissidentatus]
LSFHTFAQLKKTTALSSRSKNFQSKMTKVLTAQFGLMLVTVLNVLIINNYVLILNIAVPHSIAFLFVAVAAHSPIHSIVVLTMTPIYRRKLTQIVGKVREKILKQSSKIVFFVTRKLRKCY